MSTLASDLLELNAMPHPHGALTNHLLREIAAALIAAGIRNEMEGC